MLEEGQHSRVRAYDHLSTTKKSTAIILMHSLPENAKGALILFQYSPQTCISRSTCVSIHACLIFFPVYKVCRVAQEALQPPQLPLHHRHLLLRRHRRPHTGTRREYLAMTMTLFKRKTDSRLPSDAIRDIRSQCGHNNDDILAVDVDVILAAAVTFPMYQLDV